MDLERIKQNFRIRSGRSRKQKKKQTPSATSQAQNTIPAQHPPPSSTPNGIQAQSESGEEVYRDRFQDPQPEPQQEPVEEIGDTTGESTELDNKSEANEKVEQFTSDINTIHEHSLKSEPTSNGAIDDRGTELTNEVADSQMAEGHTSSDEDFDLGASTPRPQNKPPSLEALSELLFSSGHLNCILHHPAQLARLSAFLQKYLPEHHPYLSQYLETQKAIRAVDYANALAESLMPLDTGNNIDLSAIHRAAKLDPGFEAISDASFKALVGDALPMYVSYSLVKIVSECLVNEITGRSTPMMRDLVGGLSEVFCLADPNREDNPIIYASEEFYRLTRYGPSETLNNNCRFLQGRRTNPDSPRRLKEAITKGSEICEVLLNYKRDGRPFMNLLMIAPLHDRHGKVKYHIGAQIDVTGLVEGGRALESFQRYLHRRAQDQKREELENSQEDLNDEQKRKKRALAKLRELSDMFDLEESAVVQANSRSSSLTRDDDDTRSVGSHEKTPRRVYAGSDDSDDAEDGDEQPNGSTEEWRFGEAGDGRLSGKLPGVYDSFMLLRPAPSLRIVFVSPKLRRLGNIVQTPFLSHVAAPSATLSGINESLRAGVPLTAKIHFSPKRGEHREGTRLQNGTRHQDGPRGRAIWVSCTPMLGEADKVGVWMCVVVEKSKVGNIRRKADTAVHSVDEGSMDKSTLTPTQNEKSNLPSNDWRMDRQVQKIEEEDGPIKPVRIDSQTVLKGNVKQSSKTNAAKDQKSEKTLRHKPTVYFDAEQGEEDVGAATHSPEIPPEQYQTALVTNDSTKELASDDDTSGLDEKLDRTAIEDSQESTHGPDTNNVQTSDHSSGAFDGTTISPRDEHGNSSSPQATAHVENGQSISEEDVSPANQHVSTDIERDRSKSRSPSPVWSPASEIPPSIPSSAQFADEDSQEEDENDEVTKRQRDYSLPPRPNNDEPAPGEVLQHDSPDIGDASLTRNQSGDRGADNSLEHSEMVASKPGHGCEDVRDVAEDEDEQGVDIDEATVSSRRQSKLTGGSSDQSSQHHSQSTTRNSSQYGSHGERQRSSSDHGVGRTGEPVTKFNVDDGRLTDNNVTSESIQDEDEASRTARSQREHSLPRSDSDRAAGSSQNIMRQKSDDSTRDSSQRSRSNQTALATDDGAAAETEPETNLEGDSASLLANEDNELKSDNNSATENQVEQLMPASFPEQRPASIQVLQQKDPDVTRDSSPRRSNDEYSKTASNGDIVSGVNVQADHGRNNVSNLTDEVAIPEDEIEDATEDQSDQLSSTSDAGPEISARRISQQKTQDTTRDTSQQRNPSRPRSPVDGRSTSKARSQSSHNREDLSASDTPRGATSESEHDHDDSTVIAQDDVIENLNVTAKAGSTLSPLSPALQAHDQDPEPGANGENEDDEVKAHEKDIESWIKEGRPSSAHTLNHTHTHTHTHTHNTDQSKTSPALRMDYLRAGGNRWPRPARLGWEVLHEHGGEVSGYADDDSDDLTNEEFCVRSPYSVD